MAVEGERYLNEVLDGLPDDIRDFAVAQGILKLAQEIVKRTRRLLPVLTGGLKKGIRQRKPKSLSNPFVNEASRYVFYGKGGRHGPLLEFGTKFITPRAYLGTIFSQLDTNSGLQIVIDGILSELNKLAQRYDTQSKTRQRRLAG